MKIIVFSKNTLRNKKARYVYQSLSGIFVYTYISRNGYHKLMAGNFSHYFEACPSLDAQWYAEASRCVSVASGRSYRCVFPRALLPPSAALPAINIALHNPGSVSARLDLLAYTIGSNNIAISLQVLKKKECRINYYTY